VINRYTYVLNTWYQMINCKMEVKNMGDRLVRKGLAIGVIVLFVCIGISSAVAIKEIKVNNNDIINSSNVVSTEDLPDLKITYIETIAYSRDEGEPPFQATEAGIKNVGAASLDGYVYMEINVYGGIGPFSYLARTFREMKRLDIAPGQEKYLIIAHDVCGGSLFSKFVVSVNYENININESNYRNNLALQRFYTPIIGFWDNYWYPIGPLRYPLLFPHQLGI
jgi:hypothetical protein